MATTAFTRSGETWESGTSRRCSLKIVKAGRPSDASSVVACAMSPTRDNSFLRGVDRIRSTLNHVSPMTAIHETSATPATAARAACALPPQAGSDFVDPAGCEREETSHEEHSPSLQTPRHAIRPSNQA